MTIHLDISQLVQDPRRSGIQRAERELIRHWPGPAPLVPCHFDPATNTMQQLSAAVFDILCADAPAGGVEQEAAQLAPLLRPGRPIVPDRLLNAELFSDPGRAQFYRSRPAQCRAYWLVYDFLPWLHPDWFSVGSAARLMPYLEALRGIPDVAFISAQVRDDFRDRIVRRPFDGPVIPMGADGLGMERQSFEPSRRSFVMLGTIEPRKNALPAMQAFKRLWAEGSDARLVMIGTVAGDAPAEIDMLASLKGHPQFQHLGSASDTMVRDALRTARALVFPSEGEGYGIPPMEALHAGIPVIISKCLPAIAGQPGFGQVRLDGVTADHLMGAVRDLLDDTKGRALWQEAAQMPAFTWSDFARLAAEWVQT
jgi:glycosyltransferase involved in cell wall biosynthesis